MSYSEEVSFLLSVFKFVFKSHKEEIPPIFRERFPDFDFSSEDSHLTPVSRLGISNIIETQNIASTRASYEAAADYWLRLVVNSYSEENLLNLICLYARKCLFRSSDADEMIILFEILLDVINGAKLSGKFTKESWEKLDAAAEVSTKEAEQRREAEFIRMHRGTSRSSSSSSSSTPEKPHKPAVVKLKTDLPCTSFSVEMFAAGPSSVKSEKPDTSQGKYVKTKGIAKISVVIPEKEVKSELKNIEASGKLQSDDDDESNSKKFKEPKIGKEIEETEKSTKIIEIEKECDGTETEKCKEVEYFVPKKDSEETRGGTVKIETTMAEKCETTQTLEGPEMIQKSTCDSTVDKFLESGTMQRTEDSGESVKGDTTTHSKE